jgi:hypothetical protein
MFTLRPESVKTFVNDQTIRLPRFQRKQTWKDNKNFNLCISVYKDFPMGIIVIKIDPNQGKKHEIVKWLLDGRQRQNVLKGMKNPEKIYTWAKKTIPISSRDDIDTLANNYWDYIERYLEDEESEEGSSENGEVEFTPDLDFEDEQENDNEANAKEGSSIEEPDYPSYNGLKDLCDLLETVHPMRKRSSGFTAPFNYSSILINLPYIKLDREQGTYYVDSDALITWIDSKKAFDALYGKPFPPSKEMFLGWLTDGQVIDEDVIKKLKKHVEKNWNKILKILNQLDSLDKRLQEAKIGYLELNADCTDADAKKIFEIINTAGTPLTAAEILSAKPSWNKKIAEPHPQMVSDKEKLYKQISIKGDGVVRWDAAATFTDRLDNSLDFIIGNWREISPDKLEKKITLGFKLMSGVYFEAISRDEISRLSSESYLNERGIIINWGNIDIEEKMNLMGKILHQNNFFKYWSTWNISIMSALSDAVAINYLLVTFKDWINKGEPTNPQSTEYRLFQKNAVILFDRMVFEYVTKRWRGSSDSTISKNLKELSSKTLLHGKSYAYDPVDNNEWSRLIHEIIFNGTVNGVSYISEKIDTRMRALLYYYYLLKQKSGPNDPTISGIDVDHIIPQSLFDGEGKSTKDFMNNLANLALLPRRQNISKGNKKLNEIDDPWLRDQIINYEEIMDNQFNEMSDVHNFERLKNYRAELFIEVFEKRRARSLLL